jgi:hypothetical protein
LSTSKSSPSIENVPDVTTSWGAAAVMPGTVPPPGTLAPDGDGARRQPRQTLIAPARYDNT